MEPVDVLTAGFPCQDISAAGRRRGLRAGTRSGVAFVEWMLGLEPGWVTGVPGLTRPAMLRLGNGVVPRQGALALWLLLRRARRTDIRLPATVTGWD